MRAGRTPRMAHLVDSAINRPELFGKVHNPRLLSLELDSHHLLFALQCEALRGEESHPSIINSKCSNTTSFNMQFHTVIFIYDYCK